MEWTRRPLLGVAAVVVVVTASGCGADDDAVCVSSEVGAVCAESNGSISFAGRGLEPGSAVTIDHPDVGPIERVADANGEFGPGGGGVLSFVADTEFTFTVSAVDADGEPLQGVIVIRS
ncbi:MAG TPA: hypothetical protein VK860_15415 [Ilumatobacteraceae bacterium]|nr:hypothetical protein [Ilumatobacteraceae bacterium]